VGWFEDRAGLAGTVAVITGGAGGLGRAIVTDLAATGVAVAVVDVDPDAVGDLRTELGPSSEDAIVHHGDARDPQVLEALFAAADERWGRLDTLVNVAGGTFKAPFTSQSPRAWDALIRANFGHVLHTAARAIPAMRAGGRGGSIINLTTIEAHRAAPNFAVYSAAKAATTHFARTLAIELAPDRIRVNNVAPDITPTPNMLGLAGGAESGEHPMLDPRNARLSIPMGRVGVPTDISSAVVFLASDLAAYITGTTLHPDGGTFASSGWFNWPGSGFGNILPAELLPLLGDE
jgi:NAD(P)-dependent dehydrogenase (short-subunit alcohol dehydrogenase family)